MFSEAWSVCAHACTCVNTLKIHREIYLSELMIFIACEKLFSLHLRLNKILKILTKCFIKKWFMLFSTLLVLSL